MPPKENTYNVAGRRGRTTPNGAQVDFDPDTMCQQPDAPPGVWLKGAKSIGAGKQKQKLSSYIGMKSMAEYDIMLNDDKVKPILRHWKDMHVRRYDVLPASSQPNQKTDFFFEMATLIADGNEREAAKRKKEGNEDNESFLEKCESHANVMELQDESDMEAIERKQDEEAYKKKWRPYLRRFDNVLTQVPIQDNMLPAWFDPAHRSANVRRFWLNTVVMMHALNKALDYQISNTWYPVHMPCGRYSAETWWRLWCLAKNFEANPPNASGRASTASWKANEWAPIYKGAPGTGITPAKRNMVKGEIEGTVDETRKSHISTPPTLFNDFKVDLPPGFDVSDVLGEKPPAIFQDKSELSEMTDKDRDLLLKNMITKTTYLRRGTDVPSKKAESLDESDATKQQAKKRVQWMQGRTQVTTEDSDPSENDKDANEAEDTRLIGIASTIVCAPLPSYQEACRSLNIDPTEPKLYEDAKFTPKSHQIVFWQWAMCRELYSTIQFHILADAVGLGKTLQMLGLIYLRAQRLKTENESRISNKLPLIPYRPTLVMLPATLLNQWVADGTKFFGSYEKGGLRFKIYHASSVDGSEHLPLQVDYKNWIKSLDSESELTERTVVLTAYQTWVAREFQLDYDAKIERLLKEGVKNINSIHHHDSVAADVRINDWHKDLTWRRVICDEATEIKNPVSKSSLACQTVKADAFWYLSGTSIENSIKDILGILAVLKPFLAGKGVAEVVRKYSRDRTSIDIDKWTKCKKQLDNVIAQSDWKAGLISTDTNFSNTEPFWTSAGTTPAEKYGLFLLDYNVTKTLFQNTTHGLDIVGCRDIAQLLFRICSIRRDMSSKTILDEETGAFQTPGDDIPKRSISTIELAFEPYERKVWQTEYESYFKHRIVGSKDEKGEKKSQIRGDVERLLVIGTSNLRLGMVSRRLMLTRKGRNTLKGQQNTNEASYYISEFDNLAEKSDRYLLPLEGKKFGDIGATFLLSNFQEDPKYHALSRAQMVYDLTTYAPKMRHVVRRMIETYMAGEKLLVFVEYPITHLLIESLALLLGIQVVGLREGQSALVRHEAVDKFNDPNSGVQMLITLSSIGGRGLNFHGACSEMIIAELPINLSVAFQLMGRLVRTGQKKKVNIEILTVDNSFDTLRQGTIAKKGVDILAANIGFKLDEDDKSPETDQTKMMWICEEVLRMELGQSSSRLAWTVKSPKGLPVNYDKSFTDGDKEDEEMLELAEIQDQDMSAYNTAKGRFSELAAAVESPIVTLNRLLKEKQAKARAAKAAARNGTDMQDDDNDGDRNDDDDNDSSLLSDSDDGEDDIHKAARKAPDAEYKPQGAAPLLSADTNLPQDNDKDAPSLSADINVPKNDEETARSESETVNPAFLPINQPPQSSNATAVADAKYDSNDKDDPNNKEESVPKATSASKRAKRSRAVKGAKNPTTNTWDEDEDDDDDGNPPPAPKRQNTRSSKRSNP